MITDYLIQQTIRREERRPKNKPMEFKSINDFSLNARGHKVINTLPVKKIKKPVSLTTLREKTQREFNKFIRNRDKDKGCVSCSKGKVQQAGHYFNAGQYTALRFEENNCHGQCIACNYHKHGNLLKYRETLLRRIGEQKFNLLEATATRQRLKKWDRLELETIYQHYKKLNNDQRL